MNTADGDVHVPSDVQRRIIGSLERAIRVVGLAGSGKTETLARRVQTHIRNGVPPSALLILTFDESGTGAFIEKLRALDSSLELPEISTLDALGLKILRQDLNQNRWAHDPRRASSLIARIHFPKQSWSPRFRVTLLDVFFALKTQGFSSDGSDVSTQTMAAWLYHVFFRREWETYLSKGMEVLSEGRLPRLDTRQNEIMQPYIEAFETYEVELSSRHILDDNDRKLKAFRGLTQSATVRKFVQDRYREIVVDECQDLNRSDVLLIRQLLGQNTSLVIAGDDDQSIHEYRQARSVFLRYPDRSFSRTFTTFSLETNYRCPKAIIEPADILIRHNVERIDKHPVAHKQHRGYVRVVHSYTDEDHDDRIADVLREAIEDEFTSASEIAVLADGFAEASRLARFFADRGIPSGDSRFSLRNSLRNQVEVLPLRLAKGREWSLVIIPDASESTIPGTSPHRITIEETRRLLYMAMTRASVGLVLGYKNQLPEKNLITSADGRFISSTGPSRFLFESGLVKAELPDLRSKRVSPADVKPGGREPTRQVVEDDPTIGAERSPSRPLWSEPLDPSKWYGGADGTRVDFPEPGIDRFKNFTGSLQNAIDRLQEEDYQFAALNAGHALETFLDHFLPRFSASSTLYQRLNDAVEIEKLSWERKKEIDRVLRCYRDARTLDRAHLVTEQRVRDLLNIATNPIGRSAHT